MKYTNLFGYKLMYLNNKELEISKHELFIDQIYRFNLKKKSPVIFDIGSFIGLSIIYFKSVYPDCRIEGFEPNPNIYPILQKNIEINGFENVRLNNIGLSNIEGESTLYIDNTGDNWHSNSSLINGGWTRKEILEAVPIKVNLLSKYITSTIDILKIDVEGSELLILKEIENKLSLVENIAIEFHPNTGFKPLINILINNGFKLRYIQNGREVISPDINNLMIIKGSR